MLDNAGMTLGLSKLAIWLAQVPVRTDRGVVETPERTALLFSGPQFFIALIAGIVLAFACQLLLTNLSVAVGISYLGSHSDTQEMDHIDRDESSGSLGHTIHKIGSAVGIWTLVTVTVALFLACLLAVKLTLVTNWWMGAIIGLVIWGAYFCLLVWISSSTVGSIVGSVVNTATSGFQAILGTATAALGAKAVNDRVVATAGAAAAAVRRELGAGLDPSSIRDTLEDYLDALKLPEINLKDIRRDLEKLINDPELKALARSGDLSHIDRKTFTNLVSNHTSLSKRDINRIVDQLEDIWKKLISEQQSQRDAVAEVRDYLKSAHPQDSNTELERKLDAVMEEVRQLRQERSSSGSGSNKTKQPSIVEQALTYGSTALMATVLGKTDASNLDVQDVTSKLGDLKDKATELAGKVSDKAQGLPPSTIQSDIENYLLHTYAWQMQPDRIDWEFREVLYDPDADPSVVRRDVERLRRADFARILQQRGIFTQDRITVLSDRLERVRQEVLTTARTAEEREKSQDLQLRIETYLRSTPKEQLLNEEIVRRDFKAILEDHDADTEQLKQRFSFFNYGAFARMLGSRTDINPQEAEAIAAYLDTTRERVLVEAQDLHTRVQSETEALWVQVQDYLRNTGKEELNPESMKRDLQFLIEHPQAGLAVWRSRLARFDRDTLVQLLSQRQDLSEEQVNDVLDRIEHTWSNVTHSPQALAGKAQEKYEQTINAIADYLRSTGKSELDPEGIKQDLSTLLRDPKEGISALRHRLAQVDRDTLVKLLSQREDLNEAQVNRTIDHTLDVISGIVKSPRRFAARTQSQVRDFRSNLADYLRNTGKDELNPEAIQQELHLLLKDPRAGVESLSDRLSHFDRNTVVSLLSQRQDITEEEANQIVDRVLAVRDKVSDQLRSIQQKIQSVIDGIFNRIRSYFNSLERPELNYDGIKQDVRKLFQDPQAGFEALRDRLSSFNRETLVALLSSREDISEADANRLIDQIEGARTSVLQRTERLQQDAQRRLEDVKRQAQKQAEETRKAAATASWWLFGTALTSAVAAAFAGAIAVMY